MPRKRKPGSGGSRVGAPGQQYQNRTDLAQAPRAVPGQTYGQAGQQMAAQSAVPLPQAAPAPMPGQHGPLTAPTGQPNQPLTAGLPTGPGPGPEALGFPGDATAGDDEVEGFLRAVASQYPNSDIERLLAQASMKRRR